VDVNNHRTKTKDLCENSQRYYIIFLNCRFDFLTSRPGPGPDPVLKPANNTFTFGERMKGT
jgi:hypothetical protein